MPPPVDPVIGPTFFRENICNYMGPGGVCGQKASIHIIWERRLHSASCDEHKAKLADKTSIEQIHPFTEFCNDPRSMWYPEEETCKIPQNEAEMAIGIFLMD